METEYTKNGLQSSCYWVESLESRALFIWFILLTRDAWSNRQVWPWCAKWSGAKFGLRVQNEVGPRLTEFCQENSLVIANTLLQQHKRQLYTWTSLDTQYRNQIDYIFCSKRWGISIQPPKTRLGADYGSDHELLIAKFRLKLKTVGETTRSFTYILNEILYNYTVEVINRFGGLDLIDRVPEELWIEVHDIVQETVMKTIPKKK